LGNAASPPRKRGPGCAKKSQDKAEKRDEAAKPETGIPETIFSIIEELLVNRRRSPDSHTHNS